MSKIQEIAKKNKIKKVNIKMENVEQNVKLEFDERLFVLLSKDLYKDNLSFLRELTQNSADAQASRIQWIIDRDSRTITEIDNGKGMDYDFVLNDWKKVGKSFKKGNEIGMYGIGRLSIWQIAENVYIRTNNVEIFWNSISEYRIRKTEDFYQGFLCKIKVREDSLNVLSPMKIKAYLETNVNLENIEITVNNEEIRPIRLNYPFKIEIPEAKAIVYFKKPENSWESIKIFEKGLLVRTEHNSHLETIIDFNKPIKTLSRESMTISMDYVFEIIAEGLKKLTQEIFAKSLTSEDYYNQMKELAESIKYCAWRQDSKQLAELYPIANSVLKEFKDFYYSKDSILVERAKEKGYKVLVIQDDKEEKCCQLIGLKNLLELKEKLKRLYFINKTESEKGIRILKNCSQYMEFLTKIAEDLSTKFKDKQKGIVIQSDNLRELKELYNKDLENLDLVKKEDYDGEIKYTLGSLAFGESNDKNVIAWQSGSYTVLNLNNELVQTLLETERLDLIEETLTHEFIHRLGYYFHNEDFVTAYNTVRAEVLRWKAKNTARFETNAQISKISEKYEQALLKIPKEAKEKLALRKGSKVVVTLEPMEEKEDQ